MLVLLEVDRNPKIRELAIQTWLAHTTVLHFLKRLLNMWKFSSGWVLCNLSEMQKWLRYVAAWTHFERYDEKGDVFRRRVIMLDKTCARLNEYKMKSDEWRPYGSPRTSLVHQTPIKMRAIEILMYYCQDVILAHKITSKYRQCVAHTQPTVEHNLRPAWKKKRRHFLQKHLHL